jgi:hypothetical protein
MSRGSGLTAELRLPNAGGTFKMKHALTEPESAGAASVKILVARAHGRGVRESRDEVTTRGRGNR